ncbi:demethylmenaquinone methyltransferase [Anaeramoeba flamelloides]|uniref:Demethylmenaquinone methyltransferase n=1 Tax=Anaeramoeba flamelloides TaxID=1746091 RepID=A0ABQ8YND7_9EUKA|nr:demethylmenaquinone methyltransferase [Anaeramoeba flamelloides]
MSKFPGGKKLQKKIEALEDEDLKKRIKVQKVSVKRPQDLTEKYDVIITSMTLHHIFNTKEIVGILKTALKDGGHFMWIDYQKTESSYYFHPEDFREEVIPGFTKEEMIQILEINGFKNITVSVVQHVSKVQRVNNEDVQVELDIFLVCGRLN